MNSFVDALRRFSPQILTLIFLGYAPFFGESFRLYFQNLSGFILLAVLLTLVYWRQFKNFILEKNSTQFWWLLIILYCVLVTLPHLGEYSLYDIYLDLGAFFVMLFGLFFGKKIASKVSLIQLVGILTLILILFSGKILWMWFHKTPTFNDGHGFFIGSANYGGEILKIILRGQTPFLVSALIMIVGLLLLQKKSAFLTFGFTLLFLLTATLIVFSGVRSIYFAIIPSCIYISFLAPRGNFKKYAYTSVLLGIFFLSLYFFIGRDAMPPNPEDFLSAFPGMNILENNSWSFLSRDVVEKMSSGYIPIFNSMSLAFKMAEYLDVIFCVDERWVSGLGMGALCFSPVNQNLGNYVHSQPFWLYLKGGLLLVILFYGFIAYALYKSIQRLEYYSQQIGLRICSAVVMGLCTLDVLTNQFPTLSGAFYLGFWIGYNDSQLIKITSLSELKQAKNA